MSKKLNDILQEALNKAAAECDCPGCTTRRADEKMEPIKEADITVGAVVVEAVGNHIRIRMEVDRENGSFIIIPSDANAGVDSVDTVANDDDEKGFRFNTPEAFAEFCSFMEQVSVT